MTIEIFQGIGKVTFIDFYLIEQYLGSIVEGFT